MSLDRFEPVFRALADGTRRRVLDLLRDGPRLTGELCAEFEVSRFAVMKHLRVLEEARLVVVRRDGRRRLNYLNAVPLQEIEERWLSPLQQRWARSLLALRSHVQQKGNAMPLRDQMQLGTMRIAQDVVIDAPVGEVFAALVRDTSGWWGRPYVHDAAKAQRIVIEDHVGGRCWEDWGDGAGALYAFVTGIEPGRSLALAGPFGMRGLAHSVITFELEAHGVGTLLKVSHLAAGEMTEERRREYTAGWQDLIGGRLKALVERGERQGLGHEPAPFGQR
jgi:DNA-binding transcriptional ArsR family regulator/uncharacterized protein YndB with AHSA1/START domain